MSRCKAGALCTVSLSATGLASSLGRPERRTVQVLPTPPLCCRAPQWTDERKPPTGRRRLMIFRRIMHHCRIAAGEYTSKILYAPDRGQQTLRSSCYLQPAPAVPARWVRCRSSITRLSGRWYPSCCRQARWRRRNQSALGFILPCEVCPCSSAFVP